MGFSYLEGKNWLDVTREERLFCLYLYWDIRGGERGFVSWLNGNADLGLGVDDDWQVGFEVCFYRAGISHINSKCKNPHTSLLLVPMI